MHVARSPCSDASDARSAAMVASLSAITPICVDTVSLKPSIVASRSAMAARWLTMVEVRLSKLAARAPKSGKAHVPSSLPASGFQLVAARYVQPIALDG